MAGNCRLNAADWPHRMAPIRYLKYIGQLFSNNFQNIGISTVQDMIDYVNNHSRDANERTWRAVFQNAKRNTCVPHSSRTNSKPWNNPWPNDRQRIPAGQRRELIAGDYQYCVRKYNRCGWESTIHY